MRTQIAQMDEELQTYYDQTTKLTLQIESLEQKLGVANKENASSHAHIAILEQSALRIRSDLQMASQLVSEPKHLSHKVRSMYKTYCEKQVNYTTTVDEDVQREANRQREFLEHTAKGLRTKLDATKKHHEEDVMRIMRENQVLIREINQLRQVCGDPAIFARSPAPPRLPEGSAGVIEDESLT
jgi:chromosome segregation ATPase